MTIYLPDRSKMAESEYLLPVVGAAIVDCFQSTNQSKYCWIAAVIHGPEA